MDEMDEREELSIRLLEAIGTLRLQLEAEEAENLNRVGNKNTTTMKTQFATYPITVTLKELGFDDFEMFGWYIKEDGSNFGKSLHTLDDKDFYFNPKYCIKAPLWQQVIEWFIEEHQIIINIYGYHIFNSDHEVAQIIWEFTLWNKKENDMSSHTYYYSYEEAREAAILGAITLLKEAILEAITLLQEAIKYGK